jgi:hypothetical protein
MTMPVLNMEQMQERTSGAIYDNNAVPAHILAAANAYDAQQQQQTSIGTDTNPSPDTSSQPAEEQAPEVAQAAPQEESQPQRAPRKDYATLSAEKDASIRAMRELKERAEWERDQAFKLLKENRDFLTSYPQQQKQPTPEPEEILDDGDVVQAKHVKKILSPVLQELRAVKEELNNYRKQTAVSTDELRLKATYPDFDKVVTMDNVKHFAAAYPELAKSIDAGTDVYAKGSSVYTLIKQFGIGQEQQINNQQELIQKNLSKPRPISSVSPQTGSSPLTRANPFANGMTKELEDALRAEMYSASSKY